MKKLTRDVKQQRAKKIREDKAYNDILKAATKFLRVYKWKLACIGGVGIAHEVDGRKYAHELRIGFMGVPRGEK